MAGLRVFYGQASPQCGETVVLDPVEGRHLAKVLRARKGEAVELLDGCGGRYRGVFVGESGRSAAVRVDHSEKIAPPPRELCLLQAVPKGKGMDAIIRQAVELGVGRIWPILGQQGAVHLDEDRRTSKVGHWETVAREACKQSGNPWLPKIAEAMPLEQALSCLPAGCLGLTGSLEPGARPVWEVLSAMPESTVAVAVAIGPEGDFSAGEYQRLHAKGFHPVKLANLVLRVETATVSLLSLVNARLGCF